MEINHTEENDNYEVMFWTEGYQDKEEFLKEISWYNTDYLAIPLDEIQHGFLSLNKKENIISEARGRYCFKATYILID